MRNNIIDKVNNLIENVCIFHGTGFSFKSCNPIYADFQIQRYKHKIKCIFNPSKQDLPALQPLPCAGPGAHACSDAPSVLNNYPQSIR